MNSKLLARMSSKTCCWFIHVFQKFSPPSLLFFLPCSFSLFLNLSPSRSLSLPFTLYPALSPFLPPSSPLFLPLSIFPSSPSPSVPLSLLLTCLEGLAVDWIHDKLFWTDSLKGTVEVAHLDGSFRAVLYSGLNFPRGIAVDPFKG